MGCAKQVTGLEMSICTWVRAGRVHVGRCRSVWASVYAPRREQGRERIQYSAASGAVASHQSIAEQERCRVLYLEEARGDF